MSIPKNQHYVPRFILKNFAFNSGNNQVYVYDKKEDNSFPTNIENIATEKGFYNIEIKGKKATIETSLSNIEDGAANILEKILKQVSISKLTTDEIQYLKYFLSIQLTRTRAWRERHKDILEKINEFSHKLVPNVEVGKDALLDTSDESIKKSQIHSIQTAYEYLPYLESKTCLLYKAHKSSTFFISDNPVVFTNEDSDKIGIAERGIKLFLPISDKFALGFLCSSLKKKYLETDRDIIKYADLETLKKISKRRNFDIIIKTIEGFKNKRTITLTKSYTEDLNKLQVVYASRFICSSRNDFTLAKNIIQKYPEAKKTPMIKVLT